MALIFLGFLFSLAMAAGAIAVAAEPGRLQPAGDHELEGLVRLGDRDIRICLVDRDANGAFDDSADRLFLDLDQDDRFHPLRERFAVAPTLRIRGIGPTDRYAFSLLREPWRVQLAPIHGTGKVSASLSVPSPDGSSVSGEWIEVTATLVSRGGLHRIVNGLEDATELPAGDYRIENLNLEFQGERRWSIALSNFDKQRDYNIMVQPDILTEFELLGDLALSARLIAGAPASGKLMIQPTLVSETGLTLTRSRVGERSAAADNPLVASLIEIGKPRHGDDQQPEPLDIKSTGFACGQFCPIELSTRQRILPGMMIALSFDAGPLGGPLHVITMPQLPGQTEADAAGDAFDSSR